MNRCEPVHLAFYGLGGIQTQILTVPWTNNLHPLWDTIRQPYRHCNGGEPKKIHTDHESQGVQQLLDLSLPSNIVANGERLDCRDRAKNQRILQRKLAPGSGDAVTLSKPLDVGEKSRLGY